ncbi:MAG: hypothetical protein J0G37_03850 [Afipia sp.]|nr:hypothetical protein [Afipia sp.]
MAAKGLKIDKNPNKTKDFQSRDATGNGLTGMALRDGRTHHRRQRGDGRRAKSINLDNTSTKSRDAASLFRLMSPAGAGKEAPPYVFGNICRPIGWHTRGHFLFDWIYQTAFEGLNINSEVRSRN